MLLISRPCSHCTDTVLLFPSAPIVLRTHAQHGNMPPHLRIPITPTTVRSSPPAYSVDTALLGNFILFFPIPFLQLHEVHGLAGAIYCHTMHPRRLGPSSSSRLLVPSTPDGDCVHPLADCTQFPARAEPSLPCRARPETAVLDCFSLPPCLSLPTPPRPSIALAVSTVPFPMASPSFLPRESILSEPLPPKRKRWEKKGGWGNTLQPEVHDP